MLTKGRRSSLNLPSAQPVRDIELVLLTGAGASREFGTNGRPLPLMGDWSKLVVRKLGEKSTQFWELTDLRDDLDGPAFEKALGKFLRQAEAFAASGEMVSRMTRASVPGAPQLGQLEQWYASMRSALDNITTGVEDSLVEQFNFTRVSSYNAAQAFSELFRHLRLTQDDPIVWATTNYDPIAEMALMEMGRRPEYGEPRLMQGIAQRPLDIGGILNGLPRQTPVLHLHGKVGWYRNPQDGIVRAVEGLASHDRNYGLPVVMLPAPDKTYAGDDVLTMMWSEFESALRRAKRVLVLGHSLSDVLLVEALHDHVPLQRLGIIVFGDGSGGVDVSAAEFHKRIQQEFPTSTVLPLRFGPQLVGDTEAISLFAERAAAIAGSD